MYAVTLRPLRQSIGTSDEHVESCDVGGVGMGTGTKAWKAEITAYSEIRAGHAHQRL